MTFKHKIPTQKDFIEIDGKPEYSFVMSRKLFEPPNTTKIKIQIMEEADNEGDFEVLFRQLFINPEELKTNIRFMLRNREVVSLTQVINTFPIQKGLAEIVCYISLAKEAEQIQKAMIDETNEEKLTYIQAGAWQEISLPKIIFSN